MDLTTQLILIGAVFLLVSIVTSAAVSRVGAPLLLVFLILGMLAGEAGPGHVRFDNVPLAHLIGTLSLAIILFDGGLRTRAETFRVGLWPAMSLATVGVVATTVITGLVAAWALDLSWIQGLLIGAIIGSTDAAAVFSLLHVHGMELKQRVAATLEIESGVNDPMAVFLTITCVQLLLAGQTRIDPSVLVEFFQQMALGAVVGIAAGYGMAWLINRLTLATGLYPLLAMAGGLAVYGATSAAGGSGFLAIYLAGLVLGNHRLHAAQNILRVHDGLAWLAQIVMFLVLGLLVQPAAALQHAGAALGVAAVLMFIARPAAVAIALAPFRFPWREQLYIAWVGLRGAVPIVLALFPLLVGLDYAQLYFNIAFVVVLASLLVQGWTVAPVAHWLDLQLPATQGAVQRVNLDVPALFEHELIGYRVTSEAAAVGQSPGELYLPEGARVLTVIRGDRSLSVSEVPALEPGDYVYLFAPGREIRALDNLFAAMPQPEYLEEHHFFGDFVLNGEALLGDVSAMYGVRLDSSIAKRTLADYLAQAFKGRPVVGDRHRLGAIEFVVREVRDGAITLVGLRLVPKR
ncbi:MAG: potassium/proton antiporter [Sulfurifustaceae bacterium]